jgi:hypothetical protein
MVKPPQFNFQIKNSQVNRIAEEHIGKNQRIVGKPTLLSS